MSYEYVSNRPVCHLFSQKKLKALILLIRYSGLRISDAVAMKRERIGQNRRLFLYTQKTGKPVHIKLPESVVEALDECDDGELFWHGRGTLKSRLTEWQERLKKIAVIAGIEGRGFAHRLRDTFAVDLLNHGTPIEMVAVLLGNTVAIVQKHYAPWVESRQAALDGYVEAIWS
jgi:integrase/recombinase XerD